MLIYAPFSGDVIAALDGLPDMQMPQTDRQHMAGNPRPMRFHERFLVRYDRFIAP